MKREDAPENGANQVAETTGLENSTVVPSIADQVDSRWRMLWWFIGMMGDESVGATSVSQSDSREETYARTRRKAVPRNFR
jgi:hypothetical protein